MEIIDHINLATGHCVSGTKNCLINNNNINNNNNNNNNNNTVCMSFIVLY